LRTAEAPDENRWTDGGRTGEDPRICKIMQVQKFRGNAHARARDHRGFPPMLIRNQQVVGSSPSAGSKIPEQTSKYKASVPSRSTAVHGGRTVALGSSREVAVAARPACAEIIASESLDSAALMTNLAKHRCTQAAGAFETHYSPDGVKGVPSVRYLPSLYIRQECVLHSSKQPT
jgi:hypothetical protein